MKNNASLLVVALVLLLGAGIFVKSCMDEEMASRRKEASRPITFDEAVPLASALNSSRGKYVFDLPGDQDIDPNDLVGMPQGSKAIVMRNVWYNDSNFLWASFESGSQRRYTLGSNEFIILENKQGEALLVWIEGNCKYRSRAYMNPWVSWKAGTRVLLIFDLREKKISVKEESLALPEGVSTCTWRQK